MAAFDPAGKAKDAMTVIDCDPSSPDHGKVVDGANCPLPATNCITSAGTPLPAPCHEPAQSAGFFCRGGRPAARRPPVAWRRRHGRPGEEVRNSGPFDRTGTRQILHLASTAASRCLHPGRLWWRPGCACTVGSARRCHGGPEGGMIVSGHIMFLACPAYMDRDGAVRCGLPAEVSCRFVMIPPGGPRESVMIRCPPGHCVKGPIEFLTFEKPARAAVLHHVKLPGTGVERDREWYQRPRVVPADPRLRGHAGVRRPGQVRGPGRRGRPGGGLRIAEQRGELGT
jgi:hypothetical protein